MKYKKNYSIKYLTKPFSYLEANCLYHYYFLNFYEKYCEYDIKLNHVQSISRIPENKIFDITSEMFMMMFVACALLICNNNDDEYLLNKINNIFSVYFKF